MYNIDEKTNSITKAVIEQGEILKEANKCIILLKKILGIPDNQVINDELIRSLDGKVVSIPKPEEPKDGTVKPD